MTYAEAIQFLYSLRWFGAKFGLENTLKLAGLAGNPQNQLRFVHVAGTNGKGSTCAMLESIYRAAGLRVGLFTSPHLVSFRERIQVNRELISEADVVRLVAELRELVAAGFQPAVEPGVAPGGMAAASSRRIELSHQCQGGMMPPATSGGTPDATGRRDACPTFFEFVTVMALKYFVEPKCDLVIWETGLGGRLDATNIVTPLASVITNIGFDHQQWLGETLAQIAAEKAGIIKPGVPVVTATDEPEALEVIERAAREQHAPFSSVGPASRLSPSSKAFPSEFKVETGASPVLPLLGQHQRRNAALAVATVEALQEKIPVGNDAIRVGLETVRWPGRLQLVKTSAGQTILLDGAHNVAGAEALRRALVELFPAANPAFVLGVMRDKDYHHFCETLAPLAACIATVPVASERSASPQALGESCRKANPSAQITVCDSLAEALAQTAAEPFVVVAGSLYLVGEAMERLHLADTPTGDEKGLNEWIPADDRVGSKPAAKTL